MSGKCSHQPPLYGLVLVGGKSQRMQQEKALLSYYGQSQVRHCWELLQQCCEHVYVSCRREQAQKEDFQDLLMIYDELIEVGPLAGMLAAMAQYPKVAWLVLACDLPFMDQGSLIYLIQHRQSDKMATVYLNAHNQLPEPLCAIYEPTARKVLQQELDKGCRCPRKILIASDIATVDPVNNDVLANVNHRDEFQAAKAHLKKLS